MIRCTACLLVLIFMLSSCAKVLVKEAKPGEDGLRFYRPHPYLLVTEALDEAGKVVGFKVSPIWLPNMSQEYLVKISAGFGSAAMTPTLTDGWNLTSLTANADSKASETIGALASLVTAGAALKSNGNVQGNQKLSPGLWKLEFDSNGMVNAIKMVANFSK